MDSNTNAKSVFFRGPYRDVILCGAILIYLILQSTPVKGGGIKLHHIEDRSRSTTGPKPGVFAARSSVLSAKPRVLSAEPRVLSAKLSVLSAKPRVLSTEPRVLSAKPSVLSAKPRVLSTFCRAQKTHILLYREDYGSQTQTRP